MQYKGYTGRVEFDDEANTFHGRVVGTRDVITFQGATADELRRAFRESVDDYLAFCAGRGDKPDKPFSGKFVLRVRQELHRKLSAAAEASDESLNAWVASRLEALFDADTTPRKDTQGALFDSLGAPKKTIGKVGVVKAREKSAAKRRKSAQA